MSCAWCDEPAVTTVETEPAEYKSVNGVKTCVKFAITAPACGLHADGVLIGAMGGPEVVTPNRRGRKPRREQLSIFDVPVPRS